MAFCDLDGKTTPAIALDEVVIAVSVATIEHQEGCECGFWRALQAVGG